jgi:uncharacterized protein (DUF736 family)
MIIGVFTARPDGIFHGRISTLTVSIDELEFIPVPPGTNERGMFPEHDYRLSDGSSDMGRAWKVESGLFVILDDPFLAEPVTCHLIKGSDDGYELVWHRPQKLKWPETPKNRTYWINVRTMHGYVKRTFKRG